MDTFPCVGGGRGGDAGGGGGVGCASGDGVGVGAVGWCRVSCQLKGGLFLNVPLLVSFFFSSISNLFINIMFLDFFFFLVSACLFF